MKNKKNKFLVLLHLIKKGEVRLSIAYLLFILGIRPILSARIIQRAIVFSEKKDQEIVHFGKYIENLQLQIVFNSEIPTFYVRKIIADKLILITQSLQKSNQFLYIHCLYRDLEEQERRFKNRVIEVRSQNQGLSEKEVEDIAKKFTAKPSLLSPHVTGAAVDLCFGNNKTGKLLDYGTVIREMNSRTAFDSKELSKIQKENRKFLRRTMEKHDFVCYPGEWWHYSFGDQAWAAYHGEKYAFFGGVEKI